ncbi:LysR substrate-binding domain-containing protein [Ramlibacter sp.]|uniref:LysR substrate-binding domain-containing protein n=1 Tax=Ramlibacter sp. TaxID=1917967 RepID=UPI0017A9B27F|nr:LysR substrate-binding domain-containing protein [Ramlibacter sp.]MBA2674621.1 LysR family transcriptional regulator [Ramlibacter sp.]
MAERRRMPPLNALRAFEAAARHLSFKEAAAELFVTPTAVSHQIRHLEELVGQKLFERNGRSIALTRAGERFFPVLRDGFDRIAQSVADLQRQEDTLAISVTPAFAAMVLIPRLSQLRQLHPGITLRVEASERLVDLRKAEADLAVRYGTERARPVQSQVLYRDRYIAVASPGWLAGRALPVAAEALAQADLLNYTWKNGTLQGPTWAAWMAVAGIRGFDVGRCIGFSEESHAIQGALDGAGVALASTVLVGPELRSARLVQVHPLGLQGLAYHAEYVEDHPRLPTVLKVVNWLAGLASENPDASWPLADQETR